MSQDKSEHILVIRLSALGDVALSVPVLLTLLEQNPDVKISFLTKPFYSKILKDIPGLDVVEAKVKSKHKGIFGLKLLSKELDALALTAIADIHNVLRTKILNYFLKTKGYKIRVIDKGRKAKKDLTSLNQKIIKPLKHTTERYADVFRAFGFEVDLSQPVFLKSRILEERFKNKIEFKNSNKNIGIAPFAAHQGKVYPSDLMQTCVDELSKEQNLNIYLFGSPNNEASMLDDWAKPYKNVFCIAGQFDFEVELDLISNLDLMLSMDSGNGHLAAMYGVKVISIWGQTHPFAGFAPYHQPGERQILPDLKKYPLIPTSIYGNKSVKGYENVMRSIEPERIIDAVKKELD